MTAPVYLSSEDDSAPVITPATLGTMVNFFQAVLVDGYGSKAGLGWTMPYKNTAGTIACFKNDAGWYFQVDNAANVYTNPHVFKAHLFESMISETTGFGRVPDEVFYMSAGITGTPRWKIIGDSKGFWFLITRGYTTNNDQYHFSPFYVGEYIPFHQDNVFNQAIMGGYAYNYLLYNWAMASYIYGVNVSPETDTYRYLSIARKPTEYNPGFSYCNLMWRPFFTNNLFENAVSDAPDKKSGNHRLFSPAYLARKDMLLGQFPGLWFPYFYRDEGLQPEIVYNVGALKLLRIHKYDFYGDKYDQMAFDIGTQFRTLGVR